MTILLPTYLVLCSSQAKKTATWLRATNSSHDATTMAAAATTMAAAATYFVLGKADDEDFAKAEHLAETLMSALPSGDQLHHPSH